MLAIWASRKKLDALIEIFSKANNKDLYLDFWGTGEQESYLKEKAQSVSNISFHGPYARASQNKVLNALRHCRYIFE